MRKSSSIVTAAISSFLNRHGIRDTDRILAAFSGGADSLSLLLSLRSIHGKCVAAYVNHHLREEDELEREIALNAKNASSLGVDFIVLDADRTELDNLARSMGTECAARVIRYGLLEEYCRSNGIGYIFTAHNSDDCDETDIINFFRGGSLSECVSERSGRICRPLLGISHAQNEENVKNAGLEFSLDSTNFGQEALRVAIRNRLNPVVREIFPSFGAALRERRLRNSNPREGDEAHRAIFSAFALLGYRNSNNNRIKRRSVDELISLAREGSASGRTRLADVVILRKNGGDLLLVAPERNPNAPEPPAETNNSQTTDPIHINENGIYDLNFTPCSRVVVSTLDSGSISRSAGKLPTDCVLVRRAPFVIRPPRESDTIVIGGKAVPLAQLMKKRQISRSLIGQVRILEREGAIAAIVFEGLDAKPWISDSEALSAHKPDEEMFLVSFV